VGASEAIVVGIDGSEGAARATTWACEEARRRGAPVRLVHAWTFAVGGHAAAASTVALLADAARSLLDRCVAEARAAAPDVEVDGVVVERSPAQALIDLSAGEALLVVGDAGRSRAASLLLGSVADACVRHAQVPVVVVRAGGRDDGPVVVGVDSSAGARRALEWAAAEAALRSSALRIVHVAQPVDATGFSDVLGEVVVADERLDAEAATADAVERAVAGHPGEVERLVVSGSPAAELVAAADGASVLVVGSRGLGGFRGLLLGSVSRAVLHAAACPVVVVPADRSIGA